MPLKRTRAINGTLSPIAKRLRSRKRDSSDSDTSVLSTPVNSPQSSDDEEEEFKNETNGLIFSTKNKKLRDEIMRLVKYIADSQPSFQTLLETPLFDDDKALLFQHLEILCLIPKPSDDHIDATKSWKKAFEQAKKRYENREIEDEKTRLLALSTNTSSKEQIILRLKTSDEIKSHLLRQLGVINSLHSDDSERNKLQTWLDTCLQLPYNSFSTISDNRTALLKFAKETLDANIFGLTSVKEQILVFINARMSNPEIKESTLGLIGPPGIGKTMIARLVSKCLSIPFAQISCGGISNGTMLKGHDYTYLGSKPGQVAESLIELKCNNGVIFFDEFEKISSQTDTTSLLLHILDPVQNEHFTDSYIGRSIPLNLSQIWFILSMNSLPEDSALIDRIYSITIEGYTQKEKFYIARNHLIPRICENIRIKPDEIQITDSVLWYIIETYSEKISGVRTLKHVLRELITKVHFLHQSAVDVSFTIENFTKNSPITIGVVEKLVKKPEQSKLLNYVI